MERNILLRKMAVLQHEYKELLTKLLPYLEDEIITVALDEIVLFWNKNISLVQLFLKNYVAKEDSYVFTASTYMGIDDKENYPFMLLGNIHIMDDPLGKYCEICCKASEQRVTRNFLEQIVLTANDNIKIIEECEGKIVVLPLRLFNQMPENSLIFEIGEKAFVSLFKDINSLKDYFKKCSSFQDVMFHARKDIGNIILFDEDDDKKLPIEERFYNAIPNIPHLIEGEYTESEIFFQMVFGCIQQAVDVIVSSIEYRTIPLIRYPVALNYFLLLIDNFQDIGIGAQIRYKSCVANMVYRICNKEKLSCKGFSRFVEVIKKEKFGEKLFEELKTTVNEEDMFKVQVVAPIIEKRLSVLYEGIKYAEL